MKLILFAILFTTIKLFAGIQDQINFDPDRIKLEMSLGESKIFDVYVKNIGKTKIENYEVLIEEFNINPKNNLLDLNNKKPGERSLTKYVTILNNVPINLKAEEKYLLKVKVDIPKDYKKGLGVFLLKLTEKLNIKQKMGIGMVKSMFFYFAVNIKDIELPEEVSLTPLLMPNTVDFSLNFKIEKRYDFTCKIVMIKDSNVLLETPCLEKNSIKETISAYPSMIKTVSSVIPKKILEKTKEGVLILTDVVNNKSFNSKFTLKKSHAK